MEKGGSLVGVDKSGVLDELLFNWQIGLIAELELEESKVCERATRVEEELSLERCAAKHWQE